MTQRVVNYTYGTGNPVLPDGSIDVRDGIDNLQSFDIFMNADEDTYNQRDGEIVKTLAGAVRAVGIQRVGDFTSGCTVTERNQGVLYETEGTVYVWIGALPKIVPPSSNPASTGGVSPSGYWVDVGDASIRGELSSNGGASIVNTGNGQSVEDRLNQNDIDIGNNTKGISKNTTDISNIRIATSPNQRVKSILLSVSREGERAAALKAAYGYTALYPQGIAQDPQTGEWFLAYFVTGGPDNNVNWIDVYDSNFIYTGKTFGIRSQFAEGLLIGYVSGQRKVAHSGLTGDSFLRVTDVPNTASIIDLQVIAPTLTSAITCHTTMSSYGGVAAIMSPLGNNNGGARFGMIRFFKLDEVLSSSSPVAIGTVEVANGIIGSLDNAGQNETPPNPKATKPQAMALGPDSLAFYSGYQWYASNVTIGYGHNPKITQFSLDGLLKDTNTIKVSDVANAFSAAGVAAPLIEPEGLMYDLSGNLISSIVVGFNNVICAEGVTIPGKTQVNIENTYIGGQGGSILNAAYMTKGVSTLDNSDLNTADRAADYCTMTGSSTLRFQLVGGLTFAIAGKTFNEGAVFVEDIDGSTFYISIISNAGEYKFSASGATPRTWAMKAEIKYGPAITNPAPLGSIVQRGQSGFGQDRYVVAGANSHTAISFLNVTNGQIGSVTMAATSTSYNTTSDERLKVEHGTMPEAMDVVRQIVEIGAVQLAAFKSMPDDIRPMALAQRLHAICPWVVTPGHGEPGDDDFVPWQVDYSQLVPLLILALAQK